MDDLMKDYEEAKSSIRNKKAQQTTNSDYQDELDYLPPDSNGRKASFPDVVQVGTKIVVGGGLGLLAGVVTIAIVASAAEVVVAGVVTKIAGVVGGAMGLNMGLKKYKKDRLKNVKSL